MKKHLIILSMIAMAFSVDARPMPNSAPPEGIRARSAWVMHGANAHVSIATSPEQVMGDSLFVHISAGDALELIGNGGAVGNVNVVVVGTYLDSTQQTSLYRLTGAGAVTTVDSFLTVEYAFVDSGSAPATNNILIRKANGDVKITEIKAGQMFSGGAHKFTHGETYLTGAIFENVAGTGVLTFEIRVYPDIKDAVDLTDDYYVAVPPVTLPASVGRQVITYPQAIGVSRNSYIAVFVTTTVNEASASASIFGYSK